MKTTATRLRTSQEVEHLLDDLMNIIKLSSKAALMRIGIGLSLKEDSIPKKFMYLDKKGFEIHKQILFGDEEDLYEALIKAHYLSLEDSQKDVFNTIYFPDLVCGHIERGIRLLASEYKFAGNYDNLIKSLLNKLE